MAGIRWEEHELAIAKTMYLKGFTVKEICRRLNRGYYSVLLELKQNKMLYRDTPTSTRATINDKDKLIFIKDTVKNELVTSEHDFNLKTRSPDNVIPRQIAHSLALECTHCSLTFIGSHIGNKDHSTVLHSNKKISFLREINEEFNQRYMYLQEVVDGYNILNKYTQSDEIMFIRKSLNDIHSKILFNQLLKQIKNEKIRFRNKNKAARNFTMESKPETSIFIFNK